MGVEHIRTVLLLLVSLVSGCICFAEGPQRLVTSNNSYSGHEGINEQLQSKKQIQSPEVEVGHPMEWITTSPFISKACRTGWQYLWTHNQSLLKEEPELGETSLAERALDAFGKPVGGALLGSLSSLGSYDECLSTDHAQYCLVPMVAARLVFKLPLRYALFGVAVCIPRECTKRDAAIISEIYLYPLHLQGYATGGPYLTSASIIESFCQTEYHPQFSAGAIVTIVLCCVFLVAGVVGTCVHWTLDKFKPGKRTGNGKRKAPALFLDVLMSFSLYKNIPGLISTKASPASIRCLHGIRVISMLWIMLFHSPWRVLNNSDLYFDYDVKERATFKLVEQQGTTIGVSSFFLLSGLLVTYQRMRDMDKRKGKFPAFRYYVHRYLRLTPTFMFTVLFHWFLAMYISDGPLYQFKIGVTSFEYHLCERHWWKNLLYISNFWMPCCMGQSWYLSCDLQFYYVSPLLIVLLYYSLPLGLAATGIFFAGSIAANGAIAGYYSDGSFNVDTYAKEIYRTPYCHIAPWLVGIVLGYMFFKKVKIPNTFCHLTMPPWIISFVLLTFAAAFLLPAVAVIPHFDSLIVTALFREPMWGIGLALVVYACHSGYGGLVNSFLSMDIWLPLSRLTFSAFLIHPEIILIMQPNYRDPVLYTDLSFASYYVAVVVISYAAATVLAIFVEFPFGNLDQILLNTLERKKPTCSSWCRDRLRNVTENGSVRELSQLSSAVTQNE